MRFQVTRVDEGVNTLVLAFAMTNKDRQVDRIEVLTFKNSRVIQGHGTSAVN